VIAAADERGVAMVLTGVRHFLTEMKLLVIGSGGREHALAWKLAQGRACRRLRRAGQRRQPLWSPGWKTSP